MHIYSCDFFPFSCDVGNYHHQLTKEMLGRSPRPLRTMRSEVGSQRRPGGLPRRCGNNDVGDDVTKQEMISV